jgi:hypothetical protein
MNNNEMPFEKTNYILMAAGVGVILIGFMLMVGGNAESRDVFNPEVFSATRITVAPSMVLIGMGVVMYAIFKKPTDNKE